MKAVPSAVSVFVLSCMALLPACEEETSSTREAEADLITALTAELEKQTAEERFSGAVMIAKDGKSIYEAAYNYADRDNKVENTIDTKFCYGSMSKMYTGTSIMQLVEAGKIKLDAKVGEYLTDYPNQDVAQKVTIHHLLTHTGGTGDYAVPEYRARAAEIKEHKDFVELLGARGLGFEPGTKWEYSNYGMVLLGRIIEVVSGQSYNDYIGDHVLSPAGMEPMPEPPDGQRPEGLSIPYARRSPGKPQSDPNAPLSAVAETLPYKGTAAGGGYATVRDFIRFAEAVRNNKLVSERSVELMTTGKVPDDRGGKYAYGFAENQTSKGVRYFGHTGGAAGVNGELVIFPETGYAIAVLCNYDKPCAKDVSTFIRERLPLAP